MKKIYSLIMAILGLCGIAHAGEKVSLEEIIQSCREESIATGAYDIYADLEELEMLIAQFVNSNSESEKCNLKEQIKVIVQRLQKFGCIDILRANLICAICQEGK